MTPYINEITNYSNLFPKPKILKQIDNDTLLIAPSPISNPSKSYLIQNIKGVDNKLYYLPPKYSTDLNTTNLTNDIEYPYVFVNYISAIKYYCGFNIYFRDESYTENNINATLTITDGSNEFIIPIRSNQGGYIQLYENIHNTNGYRFGIKLTILNEFDPADVNHVIQFGICHVYEQQFTLKNFNSTIQLYSLPFDSPHGLSIIKENYSEKIEYSPTIDKSIHITLYQNHSDNNVIEKSLEVLNSYDGNFTYHGSVLSPNLVINDPLVLKSNYLEIEELKRYYYITDIETLGKDNFRVYLQVDTLMTYKEFIYKQGAYVLRNEFDYNLFLYDDRLPLLVNPKIQYVKGVLLSDSSYFIESKNSYINIDNYYCGILCVNCTDNAYYSYSHSNSYAGNLPYIIKGITYNGIYHSIVNHWSILDLFEEKSQSIVSLKTFPIKWDKYFKDKNGSTSINQTNLIQIGKTAIDTATSNENRPYEIKSNTYVILEYGYVKYSLQKNKFLDCGNNLICQLFIPYYGFYDLDGSLYLRDDYIYVSIWYQIDYITGDCVIYLKNILNETINIIEFEISVDMPFSRGDYNTWKTHMLMAGIKFGSSLLSAGGGNVMSSIDVANDRKNFDRRSGKVARGEMLKSERYQVYDTLSNYKNIISDTTIDFIKSFQGSGLTNGKMSSFLRYMYGGRDGVDNSSNILPYIIIKQKISNEDNNYNHYVGRPLNEYRELKNINGYTEISAIHLDNLDNALTQEKDEIEDYLRKGVYFPQKESGS